MTTQQGPLSTSTRGKLTLRVTSPTAKFMRLLIVAMMTCLVFAGTARANILVSNFKEGWVELRKDDGTPIKLDFIQLGDTSTTEGLNCIKLTKNKIYVASFKDGKIRAYYLSGPKAGDEDPGASFIILNAQHILGLAINTDGTVLYAADRTANGTGGIWAVDLPGGGNFCPPTTNPCFVATTASHEVIVGPGPDGNIYADSVDNRTDVVYFPPYKPNVGRWNPGPGKTFIKKGTYGGFTLTAPGGMVFDGGNNLWLTNAFTDNNGATDGIFEFTGPLDTSSPGKFLYFTPDSGGDPLGLDVSPLNPPDIPIDTCKNCIVVANFGLDSVSQVDPASCNNSTGMCALQPFFSVNSRPKYVKFIENCRDSGYLEICKSSCSTDPVSGYFDFTATNTGTSVGPIHIPVNACSGPIPVPNGTVTINETQQFGILVSDITAYDYDYQGYQINALLSFNKPFQTANVNVVSGDVSTETVTGFTNCKSGPGELKICKVAGGQGVNIGDTFMFTASGDPITYTVQAGPPPNGYCVVAKSYDVGTPVLVTELPKGGTKVSNITVVPPDRGGQQTDRSVIAIIDSGTTEVTFTNVGTASIQKRCLACQ